MKSKIYEIGRSLLEMLGVLAIIGIISMGAIISFGIAIDKYKANETLDEVSKRHVILMMQNIRDKSLDMEEFAPMTSLGYPVFVFVLENEIKGYKILLTNVPKGVCREIIASKYPAGIVINGQDVDAAVCTLNNDIEFFFNIGEGWCHKIDGKGNCCDTRGKCCPPDKPLINSSNQCVSCQGSQSIHLGADNIYTCDRCANRKTVNYYCALECSEDKIKDDSGNCRTCDDISQYYIDKNAGNIAKALACPHLTVSTDLDKVIARHCDLSNNVFAVHDYPQTCSKCTNRNSVPLTNTSVLCAKKCADNQVMDNTGNCHDCNEVATYPIFQSNENMDKVNACPKLILRDSDTRLFVQHCDLPEQILDVTGHITMCTKCDNRVLNGNNCILK